MQNDLISRSALKKTFEAAGFGDHSLIESVLAAGVYAGIDDAPTVDAVPVVRCRECKKCRNREPNIGIHWCDHWDNVVRDKDFCSFGERKADGGAEG